MQCPSHGYRIKKLFAPFVSRDGLNDGQIYPALNQLEKKKLVRKEIVRQQKSPNKNIYHITDQGREVFLDWLSGSEDETDPVKYDFFMQYSFLMKCNFFEHLSRSEKVEKLKRQIEAAREKIAEYERVREEMLERGLSDYKLRIVDFGIETQLLKIQWVNDLMDSELGKGSRSTAEKKKTSPTRVKSKTTRKKG
jgi:DNA-binding PadR family transcriptional regulator